MLWTGKIKETTLNQFLEGFWRSITIFKGQEPKTNNDDTSQETPDLVDGEIRRMFKHHKLLSDIALKMNQTSDSIYQEEWDEHAFRPQQV
ncbi:MAG: hypothetical protein GPJ34_24430 [Microcystis aeruginosa LL11-07]|nr:hypothetical protein [Microcystis aeruginosa LL11-07]